MCRYQQTLKLFLCLILAALAPRLASALVVGPYTPDANTVYLFHLNEPAGSYVATNATGSLAAGTNALAYATVTTNTFPGVGVGAPTNTAILGTTGASGFNFGNFGNCANLANVIGKATNGLGVDINQNGAFSLDNTGTVANDVAANHNSIIGTSSSLTIEALINVTGTNGNQEIVCTDDGNGTAASRGFQFRLSGPLIEFNDIGSTPSGFTTPIPSTGAHAFVANQWFHIALVHTESPSISTVIYWTRLDDANTTANPILTNTVETLDASDAMLLVIGNEGRGNSATSAGSSEGLQGLIDEVRISKVARAASQMMFAPATVTISQQPYVQEGVDFGGTGSMSVSGASALPIGYQWRLNGTPISGATNSTYSFTNAALANAGNYDCVLTNSNPSSITSAVCVVSIGSANFLAHRYGFTNDVTDSFGTANGTLFGNASVSGGALQLDGTTGTYLGLPAGLVTNQGAITIETWASFTTIVNNSQLFAFGDTNGVNGQTYIFMTPHGTTARIAITPAIYTSEQAAVSGSALDNYNGVQIVSVFAPYAGYEALYTNGVLAAINTNVTIQLSAVVNNYSFVGRSLYSGDPYQLGSVDEFRIYNGAMSASSIQQSYLQGPDNGLSSGPVAILVSPTNTTVAANQPVTFSGLASGLPAISYQWFKNGVLISGATNRTYSYNAPFSDNNATFVLKATNTVSATTYTATSSSATLTVLLPETLAWLGENGNGWNLSDNNWTNATSLVPYVQFDGAVFDNRGLGQPNVDLQFAVAPVSLLVSNNAGDYLFYSSGQNGSLNSLGTLTKKGSGKLTLDVTNTSATLTLVQNGTLQIGNGDTFGSLGSGPVTNNATLSFNRTDGIGLANDIHGTGTVSYDGSGTVTPSSTNSDYTGSTLINSGIVYVPTSSGLGATNSGTTVASGAQLYITGNVNFGAEALSVSGVGGDGNGALRKGGGGATTYSGAVTLVADTTIGVDSGATITLNSPLGISGAFTLTKNGGGTLALNATNHYAATTLTAGVIAVNTNGALGTGPVTATTSGRFVIGDGLNITNDFTANAVSPGIATGFIMVNDNTNGTVTTVSGPIALNANAANGGHFIGTFSSGYLNIAGPVTMPSATFMVVRDGRVRFANAGSSYPEIQVRANTTSIGLNNGVATNAVMDLAGNGTAFFDLNGFNQKLAGLKNTVTPANAGIGFITNSSGTAATLTLDLGTGNTYSSGSSLAGNLSLVLQSGTQIFTGTNHYTGNTTVNGGTLELATASIFTNSTVNVASGATLQLDFSTTNQVTGLVLGGVNQPLGVYNNTTSPSFITGAGSLLVAQSVATNPTNITAVVNGNTLELSWPADHTGWTLQAQTNSLNTGLGTNWVDVPGSASVRSVTNTINPANGSVFYRLHYP